MAKGQEFTMNELVTRRTTGLIAVFIPTTLMFFTFADGKDQIIAFGAADYSPSTPEFDAGKSAVRAVLGGTGKYIGAHGQVTSTRSSDGSYTQVFTLLK
jgi:hypothetical protein